MLYTIHLYISYTNVFTYDGYIIPMEGDMFHDIEGHSYRVISRTILPALLSHINLHVEKL